MKFCDFFILYILLCITYEKIYDIKLKQPHFENEIHLKYCVKFQKKHYSQKLNLMPIRSFYSKMQYMRILYNFLNSLFIYNWHMNIINLYFMEKRCQRADFKMIVLPIIFLELVLSKSL